MIIGKLERRSEPTKVLCKIVMNLNLTLLEVIPPECLYISNINHELSYNSDYLVTHFSRLYKDVVTRIIMVNDKQLMSTLWLV